MSKNINNHTIKVIDLFSGVGGLSLGAARAGFEVAGAIELNPHSLYSHSVNFPNSTHLLADVTCLSGRGLKTLFQIDEKLPFGMIGGPPCQGFSSMGHRKKNDPRNYLFVHFFQLVKEARPHFFLAENVPGILNKSNKKLLNGALSKIKRGYKIVGPIKFSACDFGAPTSRERVFIVGFRRKGPFSGLSVKMFIDAKVSNDKKIKVKTALQGLPSYISPNWKTENQCWRKVTWNGRGYFLDRLKGHIPTGVGNAVALKKLKSDGKVSGFIGTKHSKTVEKRYSKVHIGCVDSVSKSRRLDSDGFCPTLRAGTGPERGSFQAVRPLHPFLPRVITPREGARLQGFPDWFQFSPTMWHGFQQIGNSVSPILAERLFRVIAKGIGVKNGKVR